MTLDTAYFNSETVGSSVNDATNGKTIAQLQTPTSLTGIYANWDVDLDGDSTADSPWDFGTSADYPVLKADRDNDGVFTWQEFGGQGRVVGPLPAPENLTAARTASAVVLEWDAVTNADSYIVQWKSGSEEFDPSRQGMPPDPYLTLTDFPAGRYTLRVAAVANGVTGAWSEEVTTSTTTVTIAGGQRVNERDVRRGAPLAALGYTLTFSPAITEPVTVYYAFVRAGSTAQHTADFEYHQTLSSGVPAGPLLTALTAPEVGPVSQWVIDASAGSAVTTARIGVSILGDRTYEADETVQIRLLGATNAALGSTLDATSTIVNDDPMPEIIVAAAVSGAEGATLEISVGLGANSETAVTVSYEDLGTGAATSGADYTAITAGTLTFPPLNAGPQKVTIQLTEDSAAEADETINLRFHSASSNATLRGADNLGQLAVTVTIIDDDGNPTAPAAPTFGAPTTDSLVVNWTAPSDTGGSAITSYDVQYRLANTADVFTVIEDETLLTATIDGLDHNTAYEVQVRAANSQGYGGWSPSGFGSTTLEGAIFSGTLIVGMDTDAGVTTRGYRSIRSSGSLTPDGFNDGAAERRFASLAVVDVFEDWLLVSFNDAGSGTALPGPHWLNLDDRTDRTDRTDRLDSDRFLNVDAGYYKVSPTNIDWSDGQAVAVSLVPGSVPTGTIPTASVVVGATHEVDVMSYFTGTVNTYGAESSETNTATVAVSGSTVTVTGVAVGAATITVTATTFGNTAQQTFTVTVTARPTLTVTASPVTEGSMGSTTTMRFTVTSPTATTYPVRCRTQGGTAFIGVDYVGRDTATPGQGPNFDFSDPLQLSKMFDVTVNGDDIDDDGETIIVQCSFVGIDSYFVDGTGTITDDDTRGITLVTDPPTTAPDYALTVAENAGTKSYTVVLDSKPLEDVTVTLAVTPVEGTGAVSLASSATLTFTTLNWATAQ